MSEQPAEDQQPISTGEIVQSSAIEGLPQQLGFIESEELAELHRQIIEAAPQADEAQIRGLMIQYSAEGEKVVEQKQGDDYPKAQVGFLVAKALRWKEAGRDDYYPSDLRDALTYAENMGYQEAVAILEPAIAEAEANKPEMVSNSEAIDLLRSLKAEGLDLDFEESDMDHIIAMDEEELVGYLFDSLLNAGFEDPEALLIEKGILK